MLDTSNQKKISILISLGAIFEYYDFVVYGMMSMYLGPLFFPQKNSFVSSLVAFATFALGYLVRPLGGIIFGIFADRKGRKNSIICQTFFMALSTVLIGLIPIYSDIGLWASVLIIFCRFVQGISFAAELPGAMTIIKESYSKPAFLFSFVVSGAGLGAMLASGVLYWLTHTFTFNEILEFAWRIPFLLGGVLAIITFFMRKYLFESPEFAVNLLQMPSRSSFLKELKGFYKELLLGTMLCVFVSSLIIMNLFFPSYLSSYYNYLPSDVYLAISISLLVGVFFSPLVGYFTERTGPITPTVYASTFFMIMTPFFYKLLKSNNIYNLVLFLSLYQMTISTLMTCLFPLLAHLFKTSIRFTGIAVCYNVTYSVMTVSPILVGYILYATNTPSLLFGFYILCACLSLLGCVWTKKRFFLRNQLSLQSV